MKSLLNLFFVALVFCSCKKDLEPQESSAGAVPAVANAAAPPTSVTPQAAPQSLPVSPQPQMNVQQQQPSKTAPGMNPPHGQPNHRCDITVGAPLNSPPGKTASPPMQKVATLDPSKQAAASQTSPTSPTITTSSKSSPAVSTPAILNPANAAAPTAPGMNPPHGQEGHRCDVAVGAPLPKS